MQGVAEQRKREVARRSVGPRGRFGGSVAKGEAENTAVSVLSTSNSLHSLALVRSLARSLARQQQQQQHHHKTSLSCGNFSGIVTVNNVHLTFAVSLVRIVDPPSERSLSLSIIKLIVDEPTFHVGPPH